MPGRTALVRGGIVKQLARNISRKVERSALSKPTDIAIRLRDKGATIVGIL